MDIKTYLKLKLQRSEAAVKFQTEAYCYRCVRLLRNCLCSQIKPFQTNIQFILLMHPKEAKREKIGTGRISHLFLSNSKIISGVDFSENNEVKALIADPNNYCAILYPGDEAVNLSDVSENKLNELKNNGKRWVVFLIDGTWPCAKKMMKLSHNLRALPRFSFSAKHTSIFEIKEQPADFCLSTLESIHFFISECNRQGIENTNQQEDHMIRVFRMLIDYQKECASNPNLTSYSKAKRGYTKKEERTRTKKWLTRNIVLKY